MAYFPWTIDSGSNLYLRNGYGFPDTVREHTFQTLITHIQVSNFDTVYERLIARGFNAIRFMAVVRDGSNTFDTVAEPADKAGNQPFTTTDFLDTTNTPYWDSVVSAVDKAYTKGLFCVIFPLYQGYQGGNQGWAAVAGNAHNTNTVFLNYGKFLDNLLGSYPNVIWWHLGDYGGGGGANSLDATQQARYLKLIEGLRFAGRNRLAGSEASPSNTLCTAQLPGMTFGPDPANFDQCLFSRYAAGSNQGAPDGQCFDDMDSAWDVDPRGPLCPTDPPFVFNTWGSFNTREKCWAYRAWAWFAGGYAWSNFGNDNTFNLASESSAIATLDDAPTVDAGIFNQFIQGIPAYKMRPSGIGRNRAGRTLIASGGGSGTSKIVACQAFDGSRLAAVVPPTGTGTTTFALNTGGLRGNSRARWLNPTTGAYVNESTSGGLYNLTPSSSQSFTTPGDNGTGFNHWILDLDAVTTYASSPSRSPATGPSGMSGSRMCAG